MADHYGVEKYDSHATIVPALLDSGSADIEIGDIITITGATAGYVQKVDGLADVVLGVATTKVASPSSDGGAKVMVEISGQVHYRYPPDAGTVTQALLWTTCDVGADGRSIDINGSTTNDVEIVGVDLDANEVIVRFL